MSHHLRRIVCTISSEEQHLVVHIVCLCGRGNKHLFLFNILVSLNLLHADCIILEKEHYHIRHFTSAGAGCMDADILIV